ncbi:vitamin B12 transporter BtuB [Nitrosomonas stercoris]|uniref:Vitamin B12 transporter BtuB n=1 Tax=Nitrosomonas stercoris TaxID=1444684 RepID=A0A4Y1YNA7_9PROT|nr:vitamin B12 transporter BtuB [Nitrosomonas stercoris]
MIPACSSFIWLSWHYYSEDRKQALTNLIYGNPQLKPEKAETFEVSGTYKFDNGQLDVTYHRTNYRDLIQSESVQQVFRNGTPVCNSGRTRIPGGLPIVFSCYDQFNVGKAVINGVEVVLNYQIFDWWRLFSSYEYLSTKDRATGLRLLNRAADHTMRVQSLFNYHDKLLFSINMISQWDLYGQNTARQNVYVDHFNMDIKLDYFLTKQLNLFAGIDNLTDRKPADGFSSRLQALDPGARFFYAGAAIRF